MDIQKKLALERKLDKLTPISFDPKKIPEILKEIREMLFELYDRIDTLDNQLKQTGRKII